MTAKEPISSQEIIQAIPPEITALFSVLDSIEQSKNFQPFPLHLDKITQTLRLIARVSDNKISSRFRKDAHFHRLGIPTISSIPNFTDRQIHAKITTYFKTIGDVNQADLLQAQDYFSEADKKANQELLKSYSQLGLLTLGSAIRMGVLKESSSTPGDFSDARDLEDDEGTEKFHNIRGYLVESFPVDETIIYGSNSFFKVVLERGGEAIDRASQINKDEVENRLRSSVLFVVKADKLKASKVDHPDIKHEYIVGRDILPEEIDYVLVDESRKEVAQAAFEGLPCKVLIAPSTSHQLDGLYEGPYQLPDYESVINTLTHSEGAVWCHIARLKVDTYPKN